MKPLMFHTWQRGRERDQGAAVTWNGVQADTCGQGLVDVARSRRAF